MSLNKQLGLLATVTLLGLQPGTGTLRSESYQLSSVALGGGTISSGGIYALDSIFGQPLLGSASGGDFQLLSGFWPAAQVTPGDSFPTLSIERSASQIVISWPSGPATFVLQQADFLAPAHWVNVEGGTPNSVTLPASGIARFFRLSRK